MKEKIVLSDIMHGRSNNLQLLRFIAAMLVLIGHAFVLCDSGYYEVIFHFTGDEVTLGRIAVAIFFFASGLFVARSIQKKNSFKEYFKARCIRIFPLLFLMVLISVIMGVFVTSYETGKYITDIETWKYFLNSVLIPVHGLPGVFTGNFYAGVVNGALWTLPVEFICYAACFICYHIGIMKEKNMKYTIPLVVIAAGAAVCAGKILKNDLIQDSLALCVIFYIGMLYYVYREKIVYNLTFFMAVIAVLVSSIVLNVSWIGILLAFPYLLSYFFFVKRQVPEFAAWLGDLSYPLYLCAFPIQQLIIYLYGGNMNPYLNMLYSALAATACSIIFSFVEKKIILRKSRVK